MVTRSAARISMLTMLHQVVCCGVILPCRNNSTRSNAVCGQNTLVECLQLFWCLTRNGWDGPGYS